MSPRESDSTVVLLICSICLLVCLYVAIYESVKQTRLAFHGVKTDATCVRVEWRGAIRREQRTPIFRFTTEAGAAIVVDDLLGTGAAEVDDVISIVYLPTNPEVVSISGIKGWGFVLFIVTIGFMIGVFMRSWSR